MICMVRFCCAECIDRHRISTNLISHKNIYIGEFAKVGKVCNRNLLARIQVKSEVVLVFFAYRNIVFKTKVYQDLVICLINNRVTNALNALLRVYIRDSCEVIYNVLNRAV